MIGYRYDNDGYLVGQVEVQESPLEPGVFLMPPNTSITAPPSPAANTIPRWNNENWELSPNYSGIPYYKKSDKSVKYFKVGEPYDNNYTNISPPEPDYPYIIWDDNTNIWVEDPTLKNEYKINQCKQKAKILIAQYDWINDNETTPVLLNKEDFYAYRSALRELILNPVENPVFPPIPEEVWDAS